MGAQVTRQTFGARIAAVVAAVLLLGAAALAGIGPASLASNSAPAYAADPNDFVIDSFAGEYRLGLDTEGRSELHTTEHIVARFPDFDQNRGLVRDLVAVYDGHTTGLQVRSVTDQHGTPRDFSVTPEGDFLRVTIAVPEGSFVHGAQHYVIEYTQRDVTRHFSDTGADEFYWDINGTGWEQPFGSVTATVQLSGPLSAALNGNSACYQGGQGEHTPCEIRSTDGGASFTAAATALAAGENVTVAIGFTPHTFAAPPVPFLVRVPLLLLAGGALLLGALSTLIVALVRGRSARTGRAIIAQYDPPEGVSVALAANLLRADAKAMTASLLDFAVRRKLRLLHHQETNQYGAQALDPTGLLPSETITYNRIFTGSGLSNAPAPAPGTSYWFGRTDTRLGNAAANLQRRAQTEAQQRGLLKAATFTAFIPTVLLTCLGFALVIAHTSLVGHAAAMLLVILVAIAVLVGGSVALTTALTNRRTLSYEGALLRDHLSGLREYIRLAEADRIRMLQSASGAEVDEHLIVRVYERLLPYAVLFGFEREWQGELAKFYRQSNPDWAVETDSRELFFQAISLNAFTNSIMTSPVTAATPSSFSGAGSGSSFSSFSGGSSGGGFSGGGGGGGGGGGI